MDWDLIIKAAIAVTPVLVLLFVLDRFDAFNLISARFILMLAVIGGVLAAALIVAFMDERVREGFPIGFTDYSKYLAPLVEETLKGSVIVTLFALNRVGFKLDSAIAGFAVGAGFSVVENLWYLHAIPDASVGAWIVRGFGTAIMHGGATALFAVIAHEFSEHHKQGLASRYRFNPLLFLPGLAVATLVHSGFNHMPDAPLMAMLLTLLLIPATLLLVFHSSGKATGAWISDDIEAHRAALEEIRSGRFSQSADGQELARLAKRFKGCEQDVFHWVELQTELVLRAEELILASKRGTPEAIGPEDRAKVGDLGRVERRLGRSTVSAITPRLGFSRNDLWELRMLRERAQNGVNTQA